LLLLAVLALGAAAPGEADWREFDRRQSGWGESPFEYDAAGLTRRGGIVRARYRYTLHTSGVPNYHLVVRVAIDCAARRARPVEILHYGGIYRLTRREPRRERPAAGYQAIEAGSIEEALARAVCSAQ
jgi:hypothetical protein